MKPLPSSETLHMLLVYDPYTGSLVWRESGRLFGTERKGYISGYIEREHYYAHRLIYKMMTGNEPDVIDHQDGCPSNNKWRNLRSVSIGENSRNRKTQTAHRTGVSGVSQLPNGRYRARIYVDKKCIHLGRFDSLDEAVRLRKKAEADFGFHQNHGR